MIYTPPLQHWNSLNLTTYLPLSVNLIILSVFILLLSILSFQLEEFLLAFVFPGMLLSHLHFSRAALLRIVFLVGSFFFQHFEYIKPHPGLQGFCWEICWWPYVGSHIWDKFLFSCFQNSVFDFWQLHYNVSHWSLVSVEYVLGPVNITCLDDCQFLSPDLGVVSHYFFK